jgi:hypothetical protein
MTPQELVLVKSALARWRSATRMATAAARREKEELARVEGELKIIADELHEIGIDWRSEVGMDLVEKLLKARLGIETKEEEMYGSDSPRF